MPYKDIEKRRAWSRKHNKDWRAARPGYDADWAKKNGYKAQKAWKKRNPTKVLTYTRNRQTKLKNVFVESVDYAVVIERSQGLCALCQGPLIAPIEIDHIIPLSKGGVHSYANVQATHAECNRVKAAQVLV